MLTAYGYNWLGACLSKAEHPHARLRITCEAGIYESPAQVRVSRIRSDRRNAEAHFLNFQASFPVCVVKSSRSMEILSEQGQVVARQSAPPTTEVTDRVVRVDLEYSIRVDHVEEPKSLHLLPLEFSLGEAEGETP